MMTSKKKIINARINIRQEAIPQFLSLAQVLVEKSNLESGCLFYRLFQGVGRPSNFFIYEEYETQEAIEIHNSSEHFKTFFSQIEDMLDDTPVITVY